MVDESCLLTGLRAVFVNKEDIKMITLLVRIGSIISAVGKELCKPIYWFGHFCKKHFWSRLSRSTKEIWLIVGMIECLVFVLSLCAAALMLLSGQKSGIMTVILSCELVVNSAMVAIIMISVMFESIFMCARKLLGRVCK